MTVQIVNIAEKLDSFADHWAPRVVGELNGQLVKLVKVQGEYVWHSHESEDELFLVLRGSLDIHFRDGARTLREGEFCVVPRGVEHKPEASEEVCILLFEPASTRNTGNVDHAFTIEAQNLQRI